MSVANTHVLYAVTTPSGQISQIVDQNLSTGIVDILDQIDPGDGKVDPEFAATVLQEPVLAFTTTKLATALGYAGLTPLAGVCDFYFQKTVQGGTRAGATSHLKLAGVGGLLVPRTLRCSRGGAAQISYDYLPHSDDGANNPLVTTASQSLAGTPATDEMFTIGSAKVNNAAIGGITDIEVDFGFAVRREGGDGEAFPTFTYVEMRRPTIRLTTSNALMIDTAKTTQDSKAHPGQAAISNTTAVGFRKLIQGGLPDAPSDSTHVVLTINEGRALVREIRGSGNAPLGTVIEIKPTFNGTNAILVVATAAALP